jgi:CRP-like cAMP-binding protein
MEWKLLEGVPADEVQRLLQLARRRTFKRGEVVFHRGDPADSMHLVSKGRFAVRVMTPLGEQATIAVRGPGDSFGELALVAEKAPRSATTRRSSRRRRSASTRSSSRACGRSSRRWTRC